MVLFAHEAEAQRRSVRDSALTTPHFHLHGGIGNAAGDLGLRYGSGGNFGVGLHVKMKSGLYTGVQVDFGFGMGLKEPGVLSNLLTPAGQLIDDDVIAAEPGQFAHRCIDVLGADRMLPVPQESIPTRQQLISTGQPREGRAQPPALREGVGIL